jgi:hypothetical protein
MGAAGFVLQQVVLHRIFAVAQNIGRQCAIVERGCLSWRPGFVCWQAVICCFYASGRARN